MHNQVLCNRIGKIYVHCNDYWAVEAIYGHLSHRPFAVPVGTGERLAVV